MPRLRKREILLLTGLGLVLLTILADVFLLPFLGSMYVKQQAYNVQARLWEQQQYADDLLNKAAEPAPVNIFLKQEKLYELSRKHNVYLYIYDKQGLAYWTSNSVFPLKTLAPGNSVLQKLANGYYLQKNIVRHNTVYVTLIPVQHLYSLENQYLQNLIAFYQPDNAILRMATSSGRGIPIQGRDGQYLFSVEAQTNVKTFTVLGVLFSFGLLLILYSMVGQTLAFLRTGSFKSALLTYGGMTALIVLVWKVLRWPGSFFAWPIFSAEHYGSSILFPSLGDLLIFTCLLWTAVYAFSKVYLSDKLRESRALDITGIMLVCLFACLTEKLIRGLVLDSQISFDLSNIFRLNRYSFIGLLIVFIWLHCLWMLSLRTGKWIASQPGLEKKLPVLFFIFLTVCSGLYLAGLHYPLAMGFAGFSLLIIIRTSSQASLYHPGFYSAGLILTAMFLASALGLYNRQNRLEEQRVIAGRIVTDRDAVAEFLFSNIYPSLQEDAYLRSYFLNPLLSESYLQKRISQLYFTGYFSKYDVLVSTFTPEGIPLRSHSVQPLSFYLEILSNRATPVQEGYLYFLHNYNGLPSYIAVVPVYDEDRYVGTMLLELQQKSFYQESVYPELLLTENIQHYRELESYSYAVYSNKVLITQKGDYSYPGVMNPLLAADPAYFSVARESGYTHLVHHVSSSLIVVVSSADYGWLYYISVFSFLLLFLGSFLVFLLGLPYLHLLLLKLASWKNPFAFFRFSFWERISFRNKVMINVILGMTIAILLIGFATVRYITYQYSQDENDKLRQKTRVIATRLQNELHTELTNVPAEEEELRTQIKELSGLFQTDINIFDLQGNLLASTQEQIYNRQLIAPKMDALAYLRFNTQYASQLIQEEHIGKLSFTSSYLPLYDPLGRIFGYLNLPYFSQEQELNDRISSFLVAFVNIYLLLALALLALGIFMARTLTKPLDTIRRHLRGTSLTGRNEPIKWETNDEIGKLVSEYNDMIQELQESAARLAQSEREGAWKEMAKQVAHEIKNPLTPMKLNVQRLQRAMEEDPEEAETLVPKVTQMLIRQIDSLSDIATEFSNFAKMPHGNPEPVDLNHMVQETAELFGQHHNIQLEVRPGSPACVAYIDRDQLGRVMNNLVKNALQAIPDERPGHIILRTEQIGDKVLLSVEDNGAGIPEDIQRKVFVPNFSTKSGGMGMGLAIVKNIVEIAGGSISYSTETGKGTTFTVQLPAYKVI